MAARAFCRRVAEHPGSESTTAPAGGEASSDRSGNVSEVSGRITHSQLGRRVKVQGFRVFESNKAGKAGSVEGRIQTQPNLLPTSKTAATRHLYPCLRSVQE